MNYYSSFLINYCYFLCHSITHLMEKYSSTLPKQKWWGDNYLYEIGGFWYMPEMIEPVNRTINHFHPVPTDVVLTSFPKTGTTWLKSILYSIINRSSRHNLSSIHPHELIPVLEIQVFGNNNISSDQPPPLDVTSSADHSGRRIFSTHMSYQLLAKTLDSSDCRVVYVTRNPKDTLVSMWKFVNRWDKAREEPWPLEDAIEKFCSGLVPCGPYYEHVIGYRKLSLERPDKVYFTTYEELRGEPIIHFKKLAEFLGCPFEGDEQIEEIVRSCSFEVLSNYEVNKSEESPYWFPSPYNSFFRKGEVGDYKNYLNTETIERIDTLTKEKFHSIGFIYGI